MQAPSTLLSPNLHITVCRFLPQELLRGLISEEGEWWLERAMNGPKPRARRALHAEKTYVKAAQTIDRALVWAQARHGCQTPAEARAAMTVRAQRNRDPAADQCLQPYFMMTGRPFSGTVATLPNGAGTVEFCLRAIDQAVRRAVSRGTSGCSDVNLLGESLEALLCEVTATTFRECQLESFVASSPIRGSGDRMAASSWLEARSSRGHVLYHAMSYLMICRQKSNAAPLRLVFVESSAEWVRDDLGGGKCYVAPQAALLSTKVVEVTKLQRPCVMLKPSAEDYSELRLLPLDGKRL